MLKCDPIQGLAFRRARYRAGQLSEEARALCEPDEYDGGRANAGHKYIGQQDQPFEPHRDYRDRDAHARDEH